MSFPQHMFSHSRKGWMVVCLLLSFLSLGGALQTISDGHVQVKTEQTHTSKPSYKTRRNFRYTHTFFFSSPSLFNDWTSVIHWQQIAVSVQHQNMRKVCTRFSIVIENIIATSLHPATNYLPASIA